MRYLVAGGAGFIGSHVCERLTREGHDVVCLDNLLTGRRSNIIHLEGLKNFSFVHHDLILSVPNLVGAVDRVIHLASPASPPGYQRLPLATMRVNSEGTFHLLEHAKRYGSAFIYASTSEAYGDPQQHPQNEDYRGNVSSTGPRSMYDEAKRYGEALCSVFARDGADVRIVRIFNTYGTNSDPEDGRLVPNFITQALRDQPMTVYGDGRQTRSLCYVSDLVEGLILALESPESRGEVINLGNPDERTVLDYARIIKRLTGSTSEIVFSSQAISDDPYRRCPDITKATRLLGWTPSVALEAGLALTIDYFATELRVPANL